MDKIIPFNKGIHRTPSLGSDGELSECANLIPQNGELVNVRGMKEISKNEIQGSLVCIHRVEDSPNYISFDESSKTVHIYNEGLERKQSIVVKRPYNGPLSSLTFGNIVAFSGFEGEYIYLMFREGEYVLFTLSDIKIESRVVPILLRTLGSNYALENYEEYDDVYIQWPEGFNLIEDNYFNHVFSSNDTLMNYAKGHNHTVHEIRGDDDEKKTTYEGLVQSDNDCTDPVFGIIGLRMYDDSYLFFSDVFCIDSMMVYTKVSDDDDRFSMGANILILKHTIPDAFMDIVTSIDVFTTGHVRINKYDSEDASYSLLGQDFYRTLTFPLRGNDGRIFFPKNMKVGQWLRRYNGKNSSITLPLNEGSAKTVIGELFGYNSRMHVFAGKEHINIHVGNHTTDVHRYGFNYPKLYWNANGSENENYATLYNTAGPYYEILDSYKINDDGYLEYVEQEVDAVIYATITDDDGKDKELCWTGKVQYPLSPVFSVPTAKAKDITIYVDLSNVYLLAKKNEALGEYEKQVYGRFHQKLYNSTKYGLSVFVNTMKEYTPSIYGSNYYRAAGISYAQPYRIEKIGANSYEYKDDTLSDGWSFTTLQDWMQHYKPDKRVTELYFRKNQLRYGNAANPFLLESLNTVEVGTERIIAMSTSAKAVSDGQFGMFPIYAFCSDGIYALEVSEEGLINVVNPATRDVCCSAESITQIDGAVVFITDQGLKLIQGSESVLLSEKMDGHNVDENIYFPAGFFANYGEGAYDNLVVQETRDFRDILKDCFIAYDYANQLLRIYPKREDDDKTPYRYYVYSLATQEFASVIGDEFAVTDADGKITGFNTIVGVVMDYPSSIVQIDKKLYRPMETERTGTQKGLLLTRPLLFDQPFALKKLHDMRLQYSKFDGTSKCKVMVYVSNDGTNWKMVRSLRGGSYKYFRIGVITSLTDADALTGVVVRYDLERTNKLR